MRWLATVVPESCPIGTFASSCVCRGSRQPSDKLYYDYCSMKSRACVQFHCRPSSLDGLVGPGSEVDSQNSYCVLDHSYVVDELAASRRTSSISLVPSHQSSIAFGASSYCTVFGSYLWGLADACHIRCGSLSQLEYSSHRSCPVDSDLRASCQWGCSSCYASWSWTEFGAVACCCHDDEVAGWLIRSVVPYLGSSVFEIECSFCPGWDALRIS